MANNDWMQTAIQIAESIRTNRLQKDQMEQKKVENLATFLMNGGRIGTVDEYPDVPANIKQMFGLSERQTLIPKQELQKMYQPMTSTGQLVGDPTANQPVLLPQEKIEGLNNASIKAQQQAQAKFGQVVSHMSNLWAQKQGQLAETGGAGLGGGLFGKWLGAGKKKGFEQSAAYEGQIAETALALTPIITGSTRVIKSVYERLIKTLPTQYDTKTFAEEKIGQSVRNAFGLYKAIQKSGITPEYLESLPESELNNPDSQINRTISSLVPQPLNDVEREEAQELISKIFATPRPKKQSEIQAEQAKESQWQTVNGIRFRKKTR